MTSSNGHIEGTGQGVTVMIAGFYWAIHVNLGEYLGSRKEFSFTCPGLQCGLLDISCYKVSEESLGGHLASALKCR